MIFVRAFSETTGAAAVANSEGDGEHNAEANSADDRSDNSSAVYEVG